MLVEIDGVIIDSINHDVAAPSDLDRADDPAESVYEKLSTQTNSVQALVEG